MFCKKLYFRLNFKPGFIIGKFVAIRIINLNLIQNLVNPESVGRYFIKAPSKKQNRKNEEFFFSVDWNIIYKFCHRTKFRLTNYTIKRIF